MLKDSETPFKCSADKFGKAAFCDLKFTHSKIADNILFRQLSNLKEQKPLKIDFLTVESLQSLWESKLYNLHQQKDIQICTLRAEMESARQSVRQITEKNLQRVRFLVEKHTEERQAILKQRQEEAKVTQCQKELLEDQIDRLKAEVDKHTSLASEVEKQREQLSQQQSKFDERIQKQKRKLSEEREQFQQQQKSYLEEIKLIREQKLCLELDCKKRVLEGNQAHREQTKQIQQYYRKKVDDLEEEILRQSIKAKESLNKVLRGGECQKKDLKSQIEDLRTERDSLQSDLVSKANELKQCQEVIQNKEQLLDRYEQQLTESDRTVRKLKQLLLESKEELEKAKVSLEKSEIERASVMNRIRICEDEAKVWKDSYYINRERVGEYDRAL